MLPDGWILSAAIWAVIGNTISDGFPHIDFVVEHAQEPILQVAETTGFLSCGKKKEEESFLQQVSRVVCL